MTLLVPVAIVAYLGSLPAARTAKGVLLSALADATWSCVSRFLLVRYRRRYEKNDAVFAVFANQFSNRDSVFVLEESGDDRPRSESAFRRYQVRSETAISPNLSVIRDSGM